MSSTRCVSKPCAQRVLLVLLLLLITVALALSQPVAQALAADTLLGVLVIDSREDQDSSSTDRTQLKILVTNSAIYTITFDNNDNTDPSLTVTVGSKEVPRSVTKPKRTGYTFLGYFDKPTGGTQYYDEEGVGVHVWDKNSDATLYAHWSLKIKCSFPTSALMQVNALGEVAGQKDLPFSSFSVEDIKVTAVESTRGAGVGDLFANPATLNDVRVLLTPQAGSGSAVEVPLTSTGATIRDGGWTIPAIANDAPGTLLVSFGLSLPNNAQLNYLAGDGQVPLANLTYVVKAANA